MPKLKNVIVDVQYPESVRGVEAVVYITTPEELYEVVKSLIRTKPEMIGFEIYATIEKGD